MNIQAITDGAIQGATNIFEALKDVALWSGHKIQIGFTNYLIPAIKAIWSWISIRLVSLSTQIKTGPGITFSIAASLFIAGIAAFKIADRKAYEEDMIAKTAWKTIGIAAFISATVATSFGITALVVV